MDWNATPKRSTTSLASSFLAPTQQQEASVFSAAGSCKRRYSQTMEDAKVAAVSCDVGSSQSDRDVNTASSLFLDCQSLQHSLKRVRLSSSPGELRLQRDLRHLVLSSRWITVDEDLWCLQQASSQHQQQQQQQQQQHQHQHTPHGDDAAGAPTRRTTTTATATYPYPYPYPSYSSVLLQRLTTATLKLTVILPNTRNNNHNQTTTSATMAHVWLQIPRLYPHRPPVVTRITFSKGDHPDHQHHGYHHHEHSSSSSPESVMLHHDVPSTDWFPGSGNEQQQQHQHQHEQQHQHARIHSLVFTNEDENMLATAAASATAITTVYAPWSPIQRLGDALDCIIEHLMAVHVNPSQQYASSTTHGTTTPTTTPTDMDNQNQNQHHHDDASVARLSRFWHEKETASCSSLGGGSRIHNAEQLTEADRATEIHIVHRARSDSNMLGLLHTSNSNSAHTDATNVASFPLNRFDLGYERDSPWSAMDDSF